MRSKFRTFQLKPPTFTGVQLSLLNREEVADRVQRMTGWKVFVYDNYILAEDNSFPDANIVLAFEHDWIGYDENHELIVVRDDDLRGKWVEEDV